MLDSVHSTRLVVSFYNEFLQILKEIAKKKHDNIETSTFGGTEVSFFSRYANYSAIFFANCYVDVVTVTGHVSM
jgi:hypothetical protein